jgi:hypothetical protein
MKFYDPTEMIAEFDLRNEPPQSTISELQTKHRFSKQDIEEMLSMVNIVDVLENEYGLDLEPQSDQKFKTHCPLPTHNDKTPSFFVYTDKAVGQYHCFGCQDHGTILRFFQKVDGMSFEEALSRLAVMTGYTSVSEEDMISRSVRHTIQAIDEYLTRGSDSKLPGNLSDVEFQLMLAKRLKKVERLYNNPRVTNWTDKIYRHIDDLLAAGDERAVSKVWDGLPSTVSTIKKKLENERP